MRHRKKLVVLLIAFVLLVAGTIRIWYLNQQYPSPSNIYFHIGEECVLQGHQYTLLEMDTISAEEMDSLYFNWTPVYDSKGSPVEQKVIIATIEIEKCDEQPQELDLTGIVLENHSWSNAIDIELFTALNNGDAKLFMKLDLGKKVVVRCPFLVLASQLTSKQWEAWDVGESKIILSYYPNKVILSEKVD